MHLVRKREKGPFLVCQLKVHKLASLSKLLQYFSLICFQGHDDIKNMISPSSSSVKRNDKKSRNEKSWSPSKLEELNQVSNS